MEDNKKVEEMNQLLYEMRVLEETGKELELRKNEYLLQHQDMERALLTLAEINKGEKEILVPLGGNTFLKAEMKDTQKILRNVGAGVMIDEDINKTVEKIKVYKKNIEEASKRIDEQISKINERMKEINDKLSSSGLPYM